MRMPLNVWDYLERAALVHGDRVAVVDEPGAPASLGRLTAVDEKGEVVARSNHVFEGHWEQPEETAKAIVDGWFHTGDGGRMDVPYLVISYRKKDVIITGGENVSSVEVEDCPFQHPAVAEVEVIGVPDEKWARRSRRWSSPSQARRRGSATSSTSAGAGSPTSSARHPSRFVRSWCGPPPARSRSSGSASPTGRGASAA
jgi:acyl-CoA synthetase (AMP-forming)/AMP-acid ligase II